MILKWQLVIDIRLMTKFDNNYTNMDKNIGVYR